MSSPSRRIWPDTPAPGITSCMRLRVRRKVDFPHPDGPIRAVTRLASTASVTFWMALVEPYQALTSVASIDFDMVLPERSCDPARAASDHVSRWNDHKGARARTLDLRSRRFGPRGRCPLGV